MKNKQTRREKRENKNNEAVFHWKVPLHAVNSQNAVRDDRREKERQAKRLKKKIQKVNRKVARNKRDRKQLLSKKQSYEIALEKIKPNVRYDNQR